MPRKSSQRLCTCLREISCLTFLPGPRLAAAYQGLHTLISGSADQNDQVTVLSYHIWPSTKGEQGALRLRNGAISVAQTRKRRQHHHIWGLPYMIFKAFKTIWIIIYEYDLIFVVCASETLVNWQKWEGFISAVCWCVWHMSSLVLASAVIWSPCCCKRDLLEGNRWRH